MGSALHIPLPSGLKTGAKVTVTTHYKTTKGGVALQFLDKEYVNCTYDLTRDCKVYAYVHTDRPKERRSHVYSVNASRFTPVAWLPCKTPLQQRS